METASCSCFASAFSLHKTNFCLFQRGRFQATRRNTTDIPTACTKTKWLFHRNLIFLFVQGAKRWKQRRAVVLFRLFCCTKQTFASFNVDVFRQQGEIQLTFQLLAQKTKVAFSLQFDFFICARCKEVETASCSCFVSAFSLHKTNFCLFQRGRFQTTRRKCQIC